MGAFDKYKITAPVRSVSGKTDGIEWNNLMDEMGVALVQKTDYDNKQATQDLDIADALSRVAALEQGTAGTSPPQLTSPSQIVVSSNNREATFTPHIWHNLPGAKFRITQVPAGATVWVAP